MNDRGHHENEKPSLNLPKTCTLPMVTMMWPPWYARVWSESTLFVQSAKSAEGSALTVAYWGDWF